MMMKYKAEGESRL
jgi:katanin p60 ATPase-containing subunit A1